jgi:hypothetical protein
LVDETSGEKLAARNVEEPFRIDIHVETEYEIPR